MKNEIRFAYVRDSANENRVVTLAWTQKPDGDKLDVRYAFAANRVASPPKHPERIKSNVPKHHDRHCRKIGRAVAAGRLKKAETCGRNLLAADRPVLESIVDDYLSSYDELTGRLYGWLKHNNGWLKHNISPTRLGEIESLSIETLKKVLDAAEKVKRTLTLRRTVKEVFERTKRDWNRTGVEGEIGLVS